MKRLAFLAMLVSAPALAHVPAATPRSDRPWLVIALLALALLLYTSGLVRLRPRSRSTVSWRGMHRGRVTSSLRRPPCAAPNCRSA